LSARVRDAAPSFGTVVVASSVSAEVMREAMRAGVRDVLASGHDESELREAVKRAGPAVAAESASATPVTEASVVAESSPAPSVAEAAPQIEEPFTSGASTEVSSGADRPRGSGKVITVFSSKGGSGKSLLACNLAILLAKATSRRTALVDLDLGSGDLAIMFQVMPSWTFHDVAENLGRLDVEALEGYMTKHSSGVDLLPAPPEPALAEAVTGEVVTKVLSLLRTSHPYVVVDTPPAFTDHVLNALDETDEVVLVTAMDVPGIRSLKIALHTLEQLGWSRERIQLVLNRTDEKVGLRVRDVEKSLGTRIDVGVPSSRDVPLSINEGRPIAAARGSSRVLESLEQLAEAVMSDAKKPAKAGARRWLSRG
jgi:pilus assembly protein CpaE